MKIFKKISGSEYIKYDTLLNGEYITQDPKFLSNED